MAKEDNQLLVLKRIEKEREQKAATDLQSAQSFLEANQAKLKEVESYKLDYLKRMQDMGATGMGGGSYQHYQRFIVQLDQGILAQSNVVSTAKEVVTQRRQEWLMQKNKLKAVDTLLDKKAQARNAREAKAEQNQSDEFAAQKYIREQLLAKSQA